MVQSTPAQLAALHALEDLDCGTYGTVHAFIRMYAFPESCSAVSLGGKGCRVWR